MCHKVYFMLFIHLHHREFWFILWMMALIDCCLLCIKFSVSIVWNRYSFSHLQNHTNFNIVKCGYWICLVLRIFLIINNFFKHWFNISYYAIKIYFLVWFYLFINCDVIRRMLIVFDLKIKKKRNLVFEKCVLKWL